LLAAVTPKPKVSDGTLQGLDPLNEEAVFVDEVDVAELVAGDEGEELAAQAQHGSEVGETEVYLAGYGVLSIVSDLHKSFLKQSPGVLVLADEVERGLDIGTAGGGVYEVVTELLDIGEFFERVVAALEAFAAPHRCLAGLAQ
jgi:hypothetical protein